MKTSIPLAFNPTFTPGVAGVGTLNFSSYNTAYGFAVNRLLAVLNLATGTIIYAVGQGSAMAGSFNSGTNVLTLAANTSACSSGDTLECIYDAPRSEAFPGKFHLVCAASTNITPIKTSPGILGSVIGGGNGSSGYSAYIKLFDKATAPILGVGGDVPAKVFRMYEDGPFYQPYSGVTFSNGIWLAVTLGITDTDNTPVFAGAYVVDIDFA